MTHSSRTLLPSSVKLCPYNTSNRVNNLKGSVYTHIKPADTIYSRHTAPNAWAHNILSSFKKTPKEHLLFLDWRIIIWKSTLVRKKERLVMPFKTLLMWTCTWECSKCLFMVNMHMVWIMPFYLFRFISMGLMMFINNGLNLMNGYVIHFKTLKYQGLCELKLDYLTDSKHDLVMANYPHFQENITSKSQRNSWIHECR